MSINVELDVPVDFVFLLNEGGYELYKNKIKTRFSKPASTSGVAKLYTLSLNQSLAYVGISGQSISSRIRYGLKANGKNGYHGYKWKGSIATFHLSIWTAKLNGLYVGLRDLETIEAEVAYVCRNLSHKWPTHQNEIHFYPSLEWHRDAALKIYTHSIRNPEP